MISDNNTYNNMYYNIIIPVYRCHWASTRPANKRIISVWTDLPPPTHIPLTLYRRPACQITCYNLVISYRAEMVYYTFFEYYNL